MKTLDELNREEGIFLTDKGSIHGYLKYYEEMFARFRDKEINIFEVGYQYGGSCELWRRYFPLAQIRSIDIRVWEPTADRFTLNLQNKWIVPGERVKFDLVDIHNLPVDYFSDFPIDIAIDDGSHAIDDQVYFIWLVYPRLRPGGLLIIEDIQDVESALPEFRKLGFALTMVDNRGASGVNDDVFIYFTK